VNRQRVSVRGAVTGPRREVVNHAVEELIEAIRVALGKLAGALESPDAAVRADARIALERMLDAASTKADGRHDPPGPATRSRT
jgi:hypothetical protein